MTAEQKSAYADQKKNGIWCEMEFTPASAQKLVRVRIHGDRMEPRWHDGELIEFKIREDGEPMPVGADVLVTKSDKQTTFRKLVRFEGDGAEGAIVLQARNCQQYPEEIRVPLQMVSRLAVAEGAIIPR